jgi:threonine/homoserine/homoserine lactone efflux protein
VCVLDWSLVGIGLAVGMAVAAPVGPINIMVIHRGMRGGFWPALSGGLGATLGDGLYAAIAAFGISAISDLIEGQQDTAKFIGGVLLVLFGLSLILRRPNADGGLKNDTRLSQAGAAAAGFVLALANVATLFAMAALFSGIEELQDPNGHVAAALILTISVIAGSGLWVLALASLVSRYRTQLGGRWLRLINAGSGLALATCGILLLADAVFQLW